MRGPFAYKTSGFLTFLQSLEAWPWLEPGGCLCGLAGGIPVPGWGPGGCLCSLLVASLSLAEGLEGASVASWWHLAGGFNQIWYPKWHQILVGSLGWFMWFVQLIGSLVSSFGWSILLVYLLGSFGWFI